MNRQSCRPGQLGSAQSHRAFTLIELLVVMAITAILLGLIFGPLIQGFNLTNRARVQVQAQDSARRAMDVVMRDIANGVFVFDNTSQPLNLWVRALDSSNNVVPGAMPVYYAMVDLVPPARYSDQDATLQLKDTDPTTGLAINRGDLALPVAPGRVIVRYFLGLRDNRSQTNRPLKPYANFYSSPRTLTLQDHNPVILYRAVVSPYLPNGQVDTRFFAQDASGAPIVYDANFFYDTTVPPNGLPGIPGFVSSNNTYNNRGYGERWENWKTIARAMVPTDRADEVVPVLDDNNQQTYYQYSGMNFPVLNQIVRFQPTYVGNDGGNPTSINDYQVGAVSAVPTTYVEQYGHWTTPHRIYMYKGNLDNNPLPLFYFLNNGSIGDSVQDQTYDLTTSTLTSTTPAYLAPNSTPKAFGIRAAQPLLLNPASGIQIDPSTGSNIPLFTAPPKVMFTVDARRGLVNCAFPDSVMLHDSKANGYKPLPSQWLNDTTTPNNSLNTPNVAEINDRWTRVHQAFPNENAYRYIRLASPPSNGGNSPLNLLPNAKLVPGSVVVTGPDMRPGIGYGREVAYKRVRSGTDPGYNEFGFGNPTHLVNYNDADPFLRDMHNAVQDENTIMFDSLLDSNAERHKLPTVMDDGVTPAAPITVTYQFQTNNANYSVKADYLTRQLMTFSLGVRLFEFNSGQPQQVALTQKIKVRNLQR